MTAVRSDIRSASRRQIALVVLALLLAVFFAYPGSGLLLGWSSAEDGGIHRFHTVVWGIHTGLLLSVGLVALTRVTNDIRRLRFAHGEMTQAELAERMGVTRQTIIAIEQGRYSPSLEMGFQIAGALGVALEHVFQYPATSKENDR